MTPQQEELTAAAIADLRTISIVSPEPHDGRSFSDVMHAGGIAKGFIDFVGGSATGFSARGLAALEALAKTYRPDGTRRSQQASNATLAQFLSAQVANSWRDRGGETPKNADFNDLNSAVIGWFTALTQTHLHVVPCILVSYAAPPFVVGPVHFYHWSDFPSEQFGIPREQFWPTATEEFPTPNIGGLHFEKLFEMANERHAAWVAVIEISGRAEDDSVATADIAVDIALGVLQIAAPGLDIQHIARATARVPVLWRAGVVATGGQIRQISGNRSPALTISPDLFADVISNKVAPSLHMMGRRLAAYLGATSSVPSLDEAWCNAAYWFHEAIAEALDTVAVFKLETSIEVLFRAEDMSGSKSRLKKSFDAVFGLVGTDFFPGSDLTIDQFILNITTARSRVAHGTWPTINTDLPGYKKQQPVTRSQVEMVARGLLFEVARHIDAYVNAVETADDTDALLSWIKSQRQQHAGLDAQPSGS